MSRRHIRNILLKEWALLFTDHNSALVVTLLPFLIVGQGILYIWLAFRFGGDDMLTTRVFQTALQKLSKPNQQLIQAIKKAQKNSTANLNRIREVYQQTTGEEMPIVKLNEELLNLEKTGLIRRRLINNKDTPTQAWQTDIRTLKTSRD